MKTEVENVDRNEIEKFEQFASRWWDPTGEFKPLHDINPLRLGYLQEWATLENRQVLDVGCGGGILSESLADLGAQVTGIDMAQASLQVAKLHLIESKLTVDYQQATAEQHAQTHAEQYDVVTCMELLEHVPDPVSVIEACSRLVKPGGYVFFSTLNRTPKAYLFAVIGAEYVLNLLPQGTHEYGKFIKPSELTSWARAVDLTLIDISGMRYSPFSKIYTLSNDIDVNYLVCLLKA